MQGVDISGMVQQRCSMPGLCGEGGEGLGVYPSYLKLLPWQQIRRDYLIHTEGFPKHHIKLQAGTDILKALLVGSLISESSAA